MEVMICWSGARSNAMALALREWLPTVIQCIRPWMSEHNFAAGNRWLEKLGKQLATTDFGVLCLTPEALSAPWLLFEAGSLATHPRRRAPGGLR